MNYSAILLAAAAVISFMRAARGAESKRTAWIIAGALCAIAAVGNLFYPR